jgi:hypothetical protein
VILVLFSRNNDVFLYLGFIWRYDFSKYIYRRDTHNAEVVSHWYKCSNSGRK